MALKNRTQKEILDRFKKAQGEDITGFECHEYILHMTYETAKPFLEKRTTEDNYIMETKEELLERATDYLELACEEARSMRGEFAGRSMTYYKAWLWLLGSDEFEDIVDYDDYSLGRVRDFLDSLNSGVET